MAKYIITFKDPDRSLYKNDGACSPLTDKELEKARATLKKFFEYDEYVNIEIDTDKKTATVLPVQS